MSFNPTQIYYLTSLACNQRCSKCSHWKEPKQEMIDTDALIESLKEIKPMEELCIVGGEPLVFKDRVLAIIEALASLTCRVVVITNGVNVTPNFIDKIYEKNIHIIFSIDTLDKDFWKYVRGVDSYDIVMENFEYAYKSLELPKLSIQSVLAKETEKHCMEVSEFAKVRGLFHFIQDYVNIGFNGQWTELKKDKKKISVDQCFSVNRNLSILPNGDVVTCFQQNLISNCEKPIGNLQKQKVADILKSEYTQFVLTSMSKCNHPCKVLKCNQEEVNV